MLKKSICEMKLKRKWYIQQYNNVINVQNIDPSCIPLTFPNADAPAQMWVKLNCFCVAKMSGVNSSEEKDGIFLKSETPKNNPSSSVATAKMPFCNSSKTSNSEHVGLNNKSGFC